MNKKTVGIISVVASCMVYGITKHFFDKDREKEREEENKMVHDSVEKIFSESRDKQMEKLDLELEKEMEESRKKHEEEMKKMKEEHEERMKKHEEKMKKLEEERQINMEKFHQYNLRSKERFENAKTKEEKLDALNEDFDDLHAVGNEICESIFGRKLGETKIVFKGKLAEMMEEKMKED